MFKKLFGGSTTKKYSLLQKNSKGVMTEAYQELVYFMHQPNSVNLRFFFISCMLFAFCHVLLDYQRYYARTYKRKYLRILEMRSMNMHPMTDEEHELI